MLTRMRESLESLHSQESGSPVVLIGGDFNLPDISWNEGYGSVNANPAYGLETNNSLLGLSSRTVMNVHAETISWTSCSVLIQPKSPKLLSWYLRS